MPHDVAEIAARRIRALRREQHLTLETLASRSGLRAETITRVETRKMEPSLRTLSRIAAGLGVPVVSLLADDGSPPPPSSDLPPGVRLIVERLASQPEATIERARQMVDLLLAERG